MFVFTKSQYLKTVKIDLSQDLGCSENEAFIELKELTTKLTLGLKKAYADGADALIEYFREILPEIIVNHNLYQDEKTPMSHEQIADLVFSKMSLTNHVIEEYSSQVLNPSVDG